jgi:hypothetical protein
VHPAMRSAVDDQVKRGRHRGAVHLGDDAHDALLLVRVSGIEPDRLR